MTAKNKAIIEALQAAHPDAHCELLHETPFQLLVSTVLSAQTTDVQVNKVMPAVYQDYPDVMDWLPLSVEEIEDKIRTIGLYRSKARNIWKLVRMLVDEFAGQVPNTMEDLIKLPGVGRKTANVVLSNAFGVPAIAVDTHVFRVANRLGLVNAPDVAKTEAALRKAINKSLWSESHHLLIFHGRRVCSARNPKCGSCSLTQWCKYYKKLAREKAKQNPAKGTK